MPEYGEDEAGGGGESAPGGAGPSEPGTFEAGAGEAGDGGDDEVLAMPYLVPFVERFSASALDPEVFTIG